MLHKPLLIVIFGWLLISCSSSIDEPISFFQVDTPRPFGYVIGDEIKQRIIVEARQGLDLQYSSLPAKGTINRWLELNKVKINKSKTKKGALHYQIDLTYQLFYAPLEVKMLDLPKFTLQFGTSTEKEVPRWNFTAAPLRELAIRKDNGKEYMRANSATPLVDNSAIMTRLYLFLFIACCLATYLAWLYGLLTFLPKYQLFKRPSRQLSQLSGDDLANMLSIMHGALNKLNGKPLFQHKVADFYRRFPNYHQLDKELNWFFDYSNQHFFNPESQADANDADKIKALCQQCLQIERGKQ